MSKNKGNKTQSANRSAPNIKKLYLFDSTKLKQSMSLPNNEIAGMTDRSFQVLIASAIAKAYPDPLRTDDPAEAMRYLSNLTIVAANYYRVEFNLTKQNNSPFKLFPVKDLSVDAVVAFIYGYYHVVNFAVSSDTVLEGIIMGLSKNITKNESCTFVTLEPIIANFAEGLLKKGRYNFKELISGFTRDNRTEKYIISELDSDHKKMLAKAAPFANGIYIKDLYDKEQRLMSYHEAYYEHGLCFPFSYPSNYMGPDNPVPVVDDGWRPDEWIEGTYCATEERAELFWGINRAILFPYDTSYKTAFLYRDSGTGNTGKGTLTELQTNTVGKDHVATISLAEMDTGKDRNEFKLEKLTNPKIMLILDNENTVRDYYRSLVLFKKLCTNDPVQINRKGKPVVNLIYYGRVIEVYNSELRVKDNTDSFFRRLVYMFFGHRVGTTDVVENKKIRNEYVQEQAVIDWFATEAINRSVDEIPKTEESDAIVHDSKRLNDPVLRFFEDYMPKMYQDWFTPTLLYPAFVEFNKAECPGQNISFNTFNSKVAEIIANNEDLEWTYKPRKNYASKPEKIRISPYDVPLRTAAGPLVEKTKQSLNHGTTIEKEVPYLDRCSTWLSDDPIYDRLTFITCSNRCNNKSAIESAEQLYRNTCNNSVRAYFRKPEAEISNLIRIGKILISAHLSKDELTQEEVVNMLRDYCKFYDYDAENDNPFIHDKQKPTKQGIQIVNADYAQHTYSGNSELWDYLVERLTELGV